METQSCHECWRSEVNTELSRNIKVHSLWFFFFNTGLLSVTELSLRWLISLQRQRSGVWGSLHYPPDATVGWRPGHVPCANPTHGVWVTHCHKEMSGALSEMEIRMEKVRWASKEWVKMGPENWEFPILWFLCGFSHLEWDWAGKVKQWPR